MRFLIPNFSPADSFVDNVAFTLRDMGHDVLTRGSLPNRWVRSPIRGVLRELSGRFFHTTAEERWLLRVARTWHPDVVLALTQVLSGETLRSLSQRGIRLVAWWGDAPANMREMGLLHHEWDLIFLKDRDAVAKFRRVGLRAEVLHEAMNPAWHKPVTGRQNDNVVVVGNFYGYRQALVARLIAAGIPVSLYGGRLPVWSFKQLKAYHTGRYVVREEKSRVFGGGLAALNSTSLSEGNSLNCRAFEIAGAGGLQVIEARPVVAECFEPEHELLTFETFEELLGQLERARKDLAEMDKIRAAAARRARAEHTYRHRLERIIGLLR